MQLSYRGVSYESNPTSVETIKGEVKGKYRGLPWQATYAKHHRNQGTYALYYRGVSPKREKSRQLNGIPVTEPTSASSFL